MYDNSEMFQVESQAEAVNNLHLFNQNTQIIREGQKHKVVFGEFQQEPRTLHEIVMPYLNKFALTTAQVASKTGQAAYEAIKAGWLWVYNKFVDEVVPFAVQSLPKIVFVTKKQQQPRNIQSSIFQVLDVQSEDYEKIPKNPLQQGKTHVVIPLGTENDAHIISFLQKDQYKFEYQFPIDESQDDIQAKEAFMIPSQSFEVILSEVKQSYAQLQMEATHKKSVVRLQNCLIFDLQGKNSIEYDMLDYIEKNPNTTTGYIVLPEQTLRKNISKLENDPVAQLVSGQEQKTSLDQSEKVVDTQRNVWVNTQGRKHKIQAQMILN